MTASLLCASATRRLASATLLERSSTGTGEAECEDAALGAVGVGTGLGVGCAACGAPFFIAAIFAAISARFCAMRSAAA